MSSEEMIKQRIEEKFAFLKDRVIVKRTKRIFVELPAGEDLMPVLDYAIKELGFSMLLTITGLDEIERFAVYYHLTKAGGGVLNLKLPVPKDRPVVKTLTPVFPVADGYEREIKDLLGIDVEGLPPGNRYPLPDNWPKDQFPLRKDWKGEVPAQGQEVPNE